MPGKSEEAEALRRDFLANPPEEEAVVYYLGDWHPTRASYIRVGDGRGYHDLLLRAADCFNYVWEVLGIPPGAPAGRDGRVTLRLAKDEGKSGNIAYSRLYPQILGLTDIPGDKKSFIDYVNSLSLYVAANRDTALILAGPGVKPDGLPAAVARLNPKAEAALADNAKASATLARLKRRQIEQAIFRPVAGFSYAVLMSESAEALTNSRAGFRLKPELVGPFQDSGAFAGYAVGARQGALSLELAVPLVSINDIIMNVQRLEAAK